MLSASDSQNLLLQDVTFVNSPNHNLEIGVSNSEIANVTILAPPSPVSHNTDGVDIHASPFYVHSCTISTGDDNIAVHANDTLVEDSFFGNGHGASIGSLCNDFIRNVTFRNITFRNTTTGSRIKTIQNCGGHVWDIFFENLVMQDVPTTIAVRERGHNAY